MPYLTHSSILNQQSIPNTEYRSEAEIPIYRDRISERSGDPDLSGPITGYRL